LIAAAREAVQTAEDAREIAVKRIDADRQAADRQASSDAQASSQAQADEATRLKEQAQLDRAKAQADMAANQAASAAAITASQADADKARLIAQQAQQGEQAAVSDKAAMRAQLNKVLETRDSARGLIVSMSDVLFDTGQYSLKPGAREKLAKVAGILIAYPSLNIEVGGYTDNVGGDDMNQKLSENRAGAVRTYLVEQGVGTNSVSAKGFGNSLPVASNDNASGRQENRRVELVVSGDAIGTPVAVTTGGLL
jgi:outer membrane protein OmpA-like peptidoglycan-associated protein